MLVAATLLRLVLAPFTGHPSDLSIWMAAGANVAHLLSPYEPRPHLGYPPLWAFWCGAAYALSNSIMPGNMFLYIFLIKIPIVMADLAIAWLLISGTIHGTRPSLRSNDHSAIARAELFLFNPYTIIVGVVWSMMDNIVVLFVVLMVLALANGKYAWAGLLLALSISLKLYPILFLPVCLIYFIKNKGPVEQILRFLVALSATAFVVVTLPFLILHWDPGGLLGVLVAQGVRIPGGISPMGMLIYLPQAGITNIGTLSVVSVSESVWLRLLWVPVTSLGYTFLYLREKFSRMDDLFDCLLLTFGIYILAAPWISEQTVETLLVLMLFALASKDFKLQDYAAYVGGSVIVLTFIIFHVPVTSFLYPVWAVDSSPLLKFGTPILPWIGAVFAGFCLFVIGSMIRKVNRTFGHS